MNGKVKVKKEEVEEELVVEGEVDRGRIVVIINDSDHA